MDREVKSATSGCLIILALSPVFAFVRAQVIVSLWAWYIVPTFGVKQISAVAAYGISWLLTVVHQQYVPDSPKKDTTSEIVSSYIAQALATPLMALICGWLIKGWL